MIADRCKEHDGYIILKQLEKSALAEHCLKNGHNALFDYSQIISETTRVLERVILEDIEIWMDPSAGNRDSGLPINQMWKPALWLMSL